MRRLIHALIAGSLLVTGCGPEAAERVPVPSDLPQTFPLRLAGNDRHVGWALLSNDAGALDVTFLANPGYSLDAVSICASARPFGWIHPEACPIRFEPANARSASFSIPFEDLGGGDPSAFCARSAFLQLSAETTELETGTPSGTSYGGAFKSRVAYPMSCAPAPVFDGCAGDASFWTRDGEPHLPLAQLSIGGATYGEPELRRWLEHPPTSDASLALARELIAAHLNVAAGAGLPREVDRALRDADAWMSNHRDGDGRLPFGVKPGDGLLPNPASWDAGMNAAALINRFNAGVRGPARCVRP